MQWLKRDYGYLALCFGLCLTEKAFHKETQRLGLGTTQSFLKNSTANATVHFFVNKSTNKHCAIVCMSAVEKFSDIQCYALLVHEAVHIWQEHCRLIGEDSPGDEYESYVVQHISQELFLSLAKQRKPRAAALHKLKGARK